MDDCQVCTGRMKVCGKFLENYSCSDDFQYFFLAIRVITKDNYYYLGTFASITAKDELHDQNRKINKQRKQVCVDLE